MAQYVAAAAAVVGAYGTYKSGQAQQKMYNIRSRQALIRADQESLNEKRKGIAVLEKVLSTLSTINARSGAGAIDPYSGTPQVLREFAYSEGMEDFTMTRENSQLIETMGILESIENKQAGAMAAYQGRIGAITQLGMAAYSMSKTGGPKTSGSTGMPGGTASGYTSIGPASGPAPAPSGAYF